MKGNLSLERYQIILASRITFKEEKCENVKIVHVSKFDWEVFRNKLDKRFK
ncbi:hypothetical protein C8E03_102137 [Lachnotalea glycerini]|uniref:Uncharacterized protein n=1 Tax=Lachnotalea glycerini TaxID=1763509 RepID=A0A318ETX6_9FIRM|nr:hypothetical protein [Lachnotalea glycerini]PXV93369.1 hypothetical protein C8E03_102137 [Lachnotalea glycerini]